jgi:peptidylprolyl isomerase
MYIIDKNHNKFSIIVADTKAIYMKKILLSIVFTLSIVGSISAQTIVTFYTTLGSFDVELYDTLQPVTAGNFKTLVNSKFYDGVIFHRIISNFVIQGGDPTGTGTGGPGYTIPDEFDSTLSNIKKTLSMANSGPNTGGSQFFINTKNNTFLDFDKPPLTSKHPVFGIVISGWDTVEMIENVQVNGNNKPLVNVVMDSIRVTQFPLSIWTPSQAELGVAIYPNPVNNQSIVEINSEGVVNAVVSIYGQTGALMGNRTVSLINGGNQFSLNDFGVHALPTGVYYMTINTGKTITRKRFVVVK